MKPVDVPTYVEYGAADVGIAGRDVIMESRADLLQPLDLNFGHCKIAIAGPKGAANRSIVPIIRPFVSQRNIRGSRWITTTRAEYPSKSFRFPALSNSRP